jgi:hypothetical protein
VSGKQIESNEKIEYIGNIMAILIILQVVTVNRCPPEPVALML